MDINDDAVIGLIGLGNMGGGIADRLLDQGVALHLFDADRARLGTFARPHSTLANSLDGMAAAADIVLLCLPSLDAVRTCVDGLIEGGRTRLIVEMSTVGTTFVRDMAKLAEARGVSLLDAPVSGGADAARAGRLSIMLSGPEAVRQKALPILEKISTAIFTISDAVGDAQSMKLVNNLLAAANMATAFEALGLGVKMGLLPSDMVRVIRSSSGANSGFTERRIGAIASRRFDNGGKIGILAKDIRLAVEEARKIDFPIDQMTALMGMNALWEAAAHEGMLNDDVTALVRIIERRSGIIVAE